MVLVVILLIVCLAVPLIFVIKKSLDEAKEKKTKQPTKRN